MIEPQTAIDEEQEVLRQAADWVVLLHSENTDGETAERLAAWRAQSPAHAAAFNCINQLWDDLGHAVAIPGYIPSAGVQSLLAAARSRTPMGQRLRHATASKPRMRWCWRIPGFAALFFLISVLAAGQWHWLDPWLYDYYTARGEQQAVTLADGSRALLNTDTAIALDWNPSTRRIRLQRGQALFTVAPDPDRPFEVETEAAVIQALGTIFEVYAQGDGVCVTVQEHAVSLRPIANDGQPLRIEAGERHCVSLTGGTGSAERIDLNAATAWQRGTLIFKNQPLKAIVAEVNRYRSGRIVISDSELENLRVSGSFPIQDPDAALGLIGEHLHLRAMRLTPWLVVLHR